MQPDGKVLVAGSFSVVNGTNRQGIARLNANGSLDSSFNPGTGVNGTVYSVALQPDGKVLIGGEFTSVNGTNRSRFARLNVNGSLDSSFNPGTGPVKVIRSIALQSDGKVLIGGDFTTVNGVARLQVARLYGDSFSPQSPQLNIERIANNVVLSWPTNGLGFRLQSVTNLPTANNWSDLSGTPSIIGDRFYVTNVASQPRMYYRLIAP